jgi:hypothetical protein
VGLAAVELGDQALLGPQGVDGVRADRLVDLGSFDVVGVEEGEERDLELGLGAGAAEVVAVQDRPQCRCPSALGVACEQGVDGEGACEAAVLGLVDRALQSLGRELFGQVQEGAGGRGDRDAALLGDLVVRERGVVGVDAGAAALAPDATR